MRFNRKTVLTIVIRLQQHRGNAVIFIARSGTQTHRNLALKHARKLIHGHVAFDHRKGNLGRDIVRVIANQTTTLTAKQLAHIHLKKITFYDVESGSPILLRQVLHRLLIQFDAAQFIASFWVQQPRQHPGTGTYSHDLIALGQNQIGNISGYGGVAQKMLT